MQVPSYQELARCLSAARLNGYRLTPGEPYRTLIGRERWNSVLTHALLQYTKLIEIALRNSMHNALANHCQTTNWFDIITLQPQARKTINEVRQGLRRQRPDDIVAALSFGFWTSLLSREYEPILWPKLLRESFPGMPRRQRTRSNAIRTLTEIRHLRNRMAHHEPIWKLPNLESTYQDAISVIDWFYPGLKCLVNLSEDFLVTYRRGPMAYEIDLIS